MAEFKELQISNRGITLVQITDQPTFSPKQQQDILDAARFYLREKRIPTNEETFKRAASVVSDALSKSLKEKGQDLAEPKDRLRPLINRGLELREDLRERAEFFHKLTLENQTADDRLIGPFALPASLVTATEVELKNFALTGTPQASQTTVSLSEARLNIIDNLVKEALSSLPESLKDVSLDQFPKIPDRVKIIRNMIASFVFRGTFSPLITTQDLRNFVQKAKNLPGIFDEETRQYLSSGLNILTLSERPFLEALYVQTATAFRSNLIVPDETNPLAIDNFYRQFNKDLALRHPALEEGTIITIPQRVSRDQPHLWEQAPVFGNFRIPEPDILAQTIRQVNALGDYVTVERLSDGLKTWQWFYQQQRTQREKIEKKEGELNQNQTLYSQLVNDPEHPLPPEAFVVRSETQAKARRTMIFAQKEIKELTDIMEENVKRQRETEEYQSVLITRYGNNLPDFVPMPSTILLQQLKGEERSLTARKGAVTRRFTALEDLLNLDYFRYKEDESAVGILHRKDAKLWLDEQLAKVEKSSAYELTRELHEDLMKHLKDRTNKKVNTSFRNLPESFNSFYQFWLSQRTSLGKTLRSKSYPVIWQKFLDDAKAQTIALLKSTIEYLESTEQVEGVINTQLENIQRRSDELSQKQPEESILTDTPWSKNDALDYIRQAQLKNLPDLTHLGWEQLLKDIRIMRTLVSRTGISLPNVIPTQNHLREWLEVRIDQTKSQVGVIKTENKKGDLKELSTRLRTSEQLALYLDHPLFPLPEGEGLPRQEFLRILRERVKLAYATYFEEEAQNRSKQSAAEYEKVNRKMFISTLKQELGVKTQKLDQLRQRNIEGEFIGKMKPLNLVLEVAVNTS